MLGSVAGTHSYLRLPAFPSAIICDKDATPPVLPTFEFFTLSVSMTKRNNIAVFAYANIVLRYPYHLYLIVKQLPSLSPSETESQGHFCEQERLILLRSDVIAI